MEENSVSSNRTTHNFDKGSKEIHVDKQSFQKTLLEQWTLNQTPDFHQSFL